MTNFVLNSCLWVPLADISEAELKSLEKRLTVYPKVSKTYSPTAQPEPLYMYKIRDGMISIPRHYAYNRYLISAFGKDVVGFTDTRTDETGSIKFKFNAELWDTQMEPVEQTLAGLNRGSNGGLLRSPCGSGKTIMALNMIAHFGAPTLIILHDEGLLGQWKKDAKKFLGLKESEIGHVQGDVCDFVGKKLVFSITQSLHARRNSYPTALYAYPTLVIYDEVHRAGSRTFCTWMERVRAKYRLGLSATPYRWDGADVVFENHIGDIIGEGVANRMCPQIMQIWLPSLCPDIQSNGRWLIPTMISRLAGTLCKTRPVFDKKTGEPVIDPKTGRQTKKKDLKASSVPNRGSIRRNVYMAHDIIRAIEAGRKVLLLSNRIPQLKEMEKLIENRVDCKIGWYIGGMSMDAKEESKKASLILATYKMGSEGMDISDLDTVAFLTPIGNIEQSIGRILRYHEGKPRPTVLDYIDPHKPFADMSARRERFYSTNGYPITKIIRS